MRQRYNVLLLILILTFGTCSKDGDYDYLHSQLQVQPLKNAAIVEIGGRFVGLEFHQGRPVPSRISFYYPKANSIDLSTDYWVRWQSMPLELILTSDHEIDTLGQISTKQAYTPFDLNAWHMTNDYEINYTWQVCHDLPVLVFKINIKNLAKNVRTLSVASSLNPTFRTSHTYAWREAHDVTYGKNHSLGTAHFSYVDTDTVTLFVANHGYPPDNETSSDESAVKHHRISFNYSGILDCQEEIEIIQIIGVVGSAEYDDALLRSLENWEKDSEDNLKRVLDVSYTNSFFNVCDSSLQKTLHWSKALIASNIHYLDGHLLIMPCPAQYNFFFTHDFLLTSLGVLYYDLDFVKNGFEFLYQISHQDSTLAHAYYWKDTTYVTEFCGNDNWNHLWFIISSASYLKHSGDVNTIEKLFPVISKSLRSIMKSKNAEQLMISSRPDWWDIGNVYGARTYLTSLTYKAIQDYAYICSRLDHDEQNLTNLIDIAAGMKSSLVEKLWDADKKYLFNNLNSNTMDYHYYSGSLVATFFDLLDAEKRNDLLMTAREQLLDENIGIRNAMPPDFHELIPDYKFNGLEVGMPWFYFNGAVWPQGNAWYILGLIANNEIELARESLHRYMTLDGIEKSPNGQPSFYEYRITDKESPRYGEIDKPAFTWAAGFYIHALYRLSGLSENSWNVYLSPKLPDSFDGLSYDVFVEGNKCRISWTGAGNYIRRIQVDGARVNSAVLSEGAKEIVVERGLPDQPYLAMADCMIDDLSYRESDKQMMIKLSGYPGQSVRLNIVTPFVLKPDQMNQMSFEMIDGSEDQNGIFIYDIRHVLQNKSDSLLLFFLDVS
ncbi:hypothetical protein JXB12_04885 [candidate division KSB1 bacterium]|nr:hypothetical protein [candidate division KSB1 bacterium]